MVYIVCALIISGIVLYLATLLHYSLCSPLVINALVWFVMFACGGFAYYEFYPLQANVFCAWLIWFVITNMIFFLFCVCYKKNVWDRIEIRKLPIDYSLIIVFLIIWLVYRIWVVGNSGPAHFFLNLRLSAMNIEGVPSLLGPLGRVYPLVFALFLFEHVFERKENRHLRLLLWSWMLLYAIASMGKLALLTPLVSWGIIKYMKGNLKIKKFFILGIVFFVIMISVHLIRSSNPTNISVFKMVISYIYAPIVGLGYVDTNSFLSADLSYVLRFIFALGERLGFNVQPVSTIGSYVEIPNPVNTFTVLYPFLHDLGFFGVIVGAFCYGYVFSVLYILSMESPLALMLYSGYSIALIIQFFGEVFIMNFSLNLQTLIWLILIYFLSRRISYGR